MTLHEYITAHLGEPFCYGQMDCVLFAAGWVKHATGRDLVAGKKWDSEKEALRMVKAAGGLESAIDGLLARIPPNLAKDGDIALYDGCVMVFSGAYIVGPGKSGLDYINRTKACCAWSV